MQKSRWFRNHRLFCISFFLMPVIIVGIADDPHFVRVEPTNIIVSLFLTGKKSPLGMENFIFTALSFIETASQKKEGIIMKKIIRNAIRCNLCGDEIESKHCHDFRWCSCRSCAVDGGHSYLRRLYAQEGCFTDISTFEEEDSNDK